MHLKILVADDHSIVREGIVTILTRQPAMQVVAQASNGHEVLALFRQHQPDVVLLDLQMPLLDGLETLRQLIALDPHARIIVFSAYDKEELIYQALQAGAMSYLMKDISQTELIEAIYATYQGRRKVTTSIASKMIERTRRPALTNRELEVLQLLAQGYSNQQMADLLNVSLGTIKVHLGNIFQKLDVRDRTAAVTAANRRGLLGLDKLDL